MPGLVIENLVDFIMVVRALAANLRGFREEDVAYAEPNVIRRRINSIMSTFAFFSFLYLAIGRRNFSDLLGYKGEDMPDLITYNISTEARGYPAFSTVSSTNMSNPADKDQTLALKFDSSYTGLNEEKLKDFQKLIDTGNVYVTLQADFRWKLKLAGFLKYPYIYKHVYFNCRAQYITDSNYKIKHIACDY
ncbi:hypothetical protein QVD17_03280 [Tagetes erecta]|uniref:Uncharacterized protein n=1 Tax=Tagetes erecta TaxID=13708 RepID=A0AAD8L834_TARER|nr:hypothetical protein QVD17_03280 [Tagetes erecta]